MTELFTELQNALKVDFWAKESSKVVEINGDEHCEPYSRMAPWDD